ncbi:folate family ECF transporter S component [Spiroplasma apis]|uniref:Folate family ECF transporter S component n=1 Tax=Spiroplasma apis B31 TaxID=1276258 RepID=V5RH87_SPIAP|nr:folate family ECF transporter S component [Spiroplasma apis]AHB35909.1 hypothetical protein SAPIS_v1c00620 [Spiroplasma apis B31]
MNFYILTNIIGIIGVCATLIIALAMEKFTFKKISVKHLTVISTFGACSVVLTNILGYNIPILGNIRLAFGDWIIFFLGMLFGPICGVMSGISIDVVGSVIPNSFGYHAGYMFNKSVLGLLGALVFIFKKEKHILLKVILLYSIGYVLQSLLLNQIWMMSWKGEAAWVDLIGKLIKLPITLPIYISVTYSSFRIIKPLLNKWTMENVWCFRNKNTATSSYLTSDKL